MYNILIVVFTFLISYQLYLEIAKPYLIEGMETTDNSTTTAVEPTTTSYQNYNSGDALILAQQNAGNIAYLKEQVDQLMNLKTQVDTLNNEVTTMSTQLNDLAQQQADYATELTGTTTPLAVTGTDTTNTNT